MSADKNLFYQTGVRIIIWSQDGVSSFYHYYHTTVLEIIPGVSLSPTEPEKSENFVFNSCCSDKK